MNRKILPIIISLAVVGLIIAKSGCSYAKPECAYNGGMGRGGKQPRVR